MPSAYLTICGSGTYAFQYADFIMSSAGFSKRWLCWVPCTGIKFRTGESALLADENAPIDRIPNTGSYPRIPTSFFLGYVEWADTNPPLIPGLASWSATTATYRSSYTTSRWQYYGDFGIGGFCTVEYNTTGFRIDHDSSPDLYFFPSSLSSNSTVAGDSVMAIYLTHAAASTVPGLKTNFMDAVTPEDAFLYPLNMRKTLKGASVTLGSVMMYTGAQSQYGIVSQWGAPIILKAKVAESTVITPEFWADARTAASYDILWTNYPSIMPNVVEQVYTMRELPSLTNTLTPLAGTLTTINTTLAAVNTSLGTHLGNIKTAFDSSNTTATAANTLFGTLNTSVGSINTTLGTVKTSLDTGNTASGTLNTTLGTLKTSLDSGTTASGVLNTTLGTIKTSLDSGNTASGVLNTTLGTVKTSLDAGNTAFGTLNTNWAEFQNSIDSGGEGLLAMGTVLGQLKDASLAGNVLTGAHTAKLEEVKTALVSHGEINQTTLQDLFGTTGTFTAKVGEAMDVDATGYENVVSELQTLVNTLTGPDQAQIQAILTLITNGATRAEIQAAHPYEAFMYATQIDTLSRLSHPERVQLLEALVTAMRGPHGVMDYIIEFPEVLEYIKYDTLTLDRLFKTGLYPR